MSIETAEQLSALRKAGSIVCGMLEAMKANVCPGVTTGELDEIGAEVMRRERANSAPALVYGFPGTSCISINDEAVHGVPGNRVIRYGDLVTLDVTVEKDGYIADAAETVVAGATSEENQRLISCARRAFEKAMLVARAGFRVNEIGRMIEREVRQNGFSVIRELGGHGIGRTIHEEPFVPNYPDRRANEFLTDGLVITVEPIISAGTGNVVTDRDGWTVRTSDGYPSAHYEHTIVITKGRPILMTASEHN
jgi:methionyl aminopeptidase